MRTRTQDQRWPDLAVKAEQIARATHDERLVEMAKLAEEDLIKHLREDKCPDCRKKIAKLARSGAKLSAALLHAAGIEVLN